MLSFLVPKVEGYTVGSHPTVVRYLRGVSKLKPPTPRYNFTGDVNPVLNFLESLWPLESLSLENLTYKTIGLLSLATAQRCQTFSIIDRTNIHIGDDRIQILIPKPVKTSKPGSFQPCLTLPKFVAKPALCIYTCVMYYISKTESLGNGENSLFISFQKPHKKVGSQTISRWIKLVLQRGGINTNLFTAHSVRHSVTSKAFRNGISIDQIRQKAGWTHQSTVFAKFYNLPLNDSLQFCNAIFDSSIN